MSKDVISMIGNTPLVQLKFLSNVGFQLFAKLEGFNLGGSIKDRTALSIIKAGIKDGKISSGTTVVESSSGNMGIGLAQICLHFGLRFVCVVDPKATRQNIAIMKAYGAEVDLVTAPDLLTGEFLQARLDRVKQLVAETKGSFWPNQYANLWNPRAHQDTMREIADAIGDPVDYLFCAASTCGTLRGCSEYVHSHHLGTRIIAVDAVGSVIFGGKAAKRLIPGHGAALVPLLYKPGLEDECVHVSDLDCIVGCRRLVREELILAGGSSGAVFTAVHKLQNRIPDGSNCAIILPDRGERYLDTIYSDSWVLEHFGKVAHLWEIPVPNLLSLREPIEQRSVVEPSSSVLTVS